MLKLGSIYPRYVGPRLIIPGVHWMGGGYVRFATPGYVLLRAMFYSSVVIGLRPL